MQAPGQDDPGESQSDDQQPTIRRQLNRPSPKGLDASEPVQENLDQAAGQASAKDSKPIVGIGSGITSHIDAPMEEKAPKESGLITFLGAQEPPKGEEIITFLGEKPAEGTPEAAAIDELTHEVVLADQVPDRLLPFIVRSKKKKPETKMSPTDALKALEEIKVH